MKQWWIIPVLVWSLTCAAQSSDSLQQKAQQAAITDSQLVYTTRLLRSNDSITKADAAEKQQLLEQIETLKNNDQQKQTLLKRLADVESKDSLRKARQQGRIALLRSRQKGIPVTPFLDTLFYVYGKIGPFGPSDRAHNTSNKIRKLADDPLFAADSVKVSPNEDIIDVTYNDLILLSITDDDALWLNEDKNSVAEGYAAMIRKSVLDYKEANSLKSMLIRVAWLLLILLIFSGIIYLVNRFFSRLRRKIVQEKDKFFKGIKVKDYPLLNPQKQLGMAYSVLKVVRIIIILLIVYITLPFVFSIFPWTKGIADSLISWTLAPIKAMLAAMLGYLPKLLTILVIYLVTRYLVKFINYLAGEVSKGALNIKGFYPDWAMPTASVVKFLLYAFMFVIIFPYLPGSDSKIFQGVSVFLGILFSLGSSSAIANIIAGFVITYMRPFKIGDRIKIGELTGDVIEKNMLVTRLRTIKNEEITVPNASILSGHTINYTSSARELGLILHTTATIGYDVPWRKVHELLIAAALATDGVVKERKPFVLQTSLDDFSVAYELNAYTDHPENMAVIYSGLHQNIQDRFNEAGIEIMSPHYITRREDNINTTIPAEYLSKKQPPPGDAAPKG